MKWLITLLLMFQLTSLVAQKQSIVKSYDYKLGGDFDCVSLLKSDSGSLVAVGNLTPLNASSEIPVIIRFDTFHIPISCDTFSSQSLERIENSFLYDNRIWGIGSKRLENSVFSDIIYFNQDTSTLLGQTYFLDYAAITNSNTHEILTGWNNNSSFFLKKTDSKGNVKWQKSYENISGTLQHIVVDHQDNIILTGRYIIGNINVKDWLLIKLNQKGEILWTKKIGGTSSEGTDYEVTLNVIPNPKGYLLVDHSNSFGPIYSIIVTLLNFEGELIWSKRLSATNNLLVNRNATIIKDGKIWITGNSYDADTSGIAMNLNLIDGKLLWSKKVLGYNHFEYRAISFDQNEKHLVFLGQSNDGSSPTQIILTSTLQGGGCQWEKYSLTSLNLNPFINIENIDSYETKDTLTEKTGYEIPKATLGIQIIDSCQQIYSLDVKKTWSGCRKDVITILPSGNTTDCLWSNLSGDTLSISKSLNIELLKNQKVIVTSVNTGFSDTLSLKVLVDGECAIKVYELITPNGDQKNDALFIKNLENYSENNIAIYNQWGQEVYRKENYISGAWAGDKLSDGTYFYILNIPDVGILKGSLLLSR